jgi:diguanylate cyclase (GGDEF)-like protein
VRIHWANLGLVSCAASAQLLWLYTAGGEASVPTVLVTAELVTAILCVLLIGYPYRSAAVLVAGVLYAAAASLALVLGQPGAAGWAPLLYPLPVLALAYLLAQIEEKLSFSEYHMRYSAERSRAKLQEQLGREEMLVKRLEETRAALEKEIEERKEVERGLERIAAFDELTSVYNRRAGLEVLKEAFHYARRNGLSLSVVFLDVDKLKYVNDNYGHGAGDEYLKEVVQTIRRHLRKSDSICRFGGDEFIVILTECRREKAMEIFTRIEEDLRDGEPRWGLEDLSFSYGTAEVTPEDEETAVDDLISLADKRMYIHKQWKKRS